MPIISVVALLGLIVGLAVERKKLMRAGLGRHLSTWLVQLVYPSLIFSSLLLRFKSSELKELWILPVIIFGILGLGLGLGLLTRSRTRLFSDKTRRSYVFLAIMPNYSFIPLVIAQTFFGDTAMGYVAVASVGADLFLWTFGFPQISGQFSVRKIFSPALMSVVLALLISLFLGERPEWFHTFLLGLNAFGKITLPLSMFILGIQLMRAPLNIPKIEMRAHLVIFIWRLLLCPAILFAILLFSVIDIPPTAKIALMLAGSMPGAIITVVLSELYDADSRFAATSIFWGHLLGIATVLGWLSLSTSIFH